MGAEGDIEFGPARLREGASLTAGDVLGDCEILALEGFGAMGAVYRARQRSLGRIVALKVIREAFAGTAEYRERFLREARLAASVDHPHVVSVFDAGEQDGRLFLTMQYVQGEDLRHILEATARLAPGEMVTIVSQLAGALEAIHSAGLIHRDIKPANVVLREMGGGNHAYLTDFGLAKPADAGALEITQTGYVLGTPGYMSPEQIEGDRPGARSDLYALGCVAFELLTGERPFRRDSELALLMAHATAPRPLPSELVPELGTRYDEFFAGALAIDPAERFASARELGEELRAAHARGALSPDLTRTATLVLPSTPPAPVAGELVPATPKPTELVGAAPRPRGRRRRWPLALVGLLAVAGAGFAAVMFGSRLFHHTARHRQQTLAARQVQPPQPTTTPIAATQPASPPASTSCGGDLTAGSNTTCGFARNVELAYDRSGGGAAVVTALSPKTGRAYTLHCTGDSPHVCTGGQGASMTFNSGPADPMHFLACDPNISAGPDTTCAFAENVFLADYRAWKAMGSTAAAGLLAFSPKAAASYPVTCTNAASTVTCSTIEGALVTFPLKAIVVYVPHLNGAAQHP